MHVITNFAAVASQRRVVPQHRTQTVLLRRWGFSEQEAAGLLPDLDSLGGRLHWTLDEKASPRPALVIHLVDATRLSGVFGNAHWNALGPVEAVRKAYQRGHHEIAMALGSAHHLPSHRLGCWALCGTRSLVEALGILARTVIEPLLVRTGQHPWSFRDLAAMNALCILSKETAQDHDTLARRVTSNIATALNFSYAPPARVVLAAESQVLDHVESLNPLMRDRLRAFRRQPSSSDLSAEAVIAYPWPTSLADPTCGDSGASA